MRNWSFDLQRLSCRRMATVLALVFGTFVVSGGESNRPRDADGGESAAPVRFCRFQRGNDVSYGLVDGEKVVAIEGSPFGEWRKTAREFALSEVRLLVPCQPTQVLAMAGNYRSHLKDSIDDPRFQIVQPFFKSVSCLTATDTAIVIPRGANDVHYEAEMVIVIGRIAAKVPEDRALECVLGVTCGNDVSAREWQKNDIQWWRAKGSDTFGPCGPFIVSGIDYDNLSLALRLNGKTVQRTNTRELIHNVAKQVSVISRHITLHPGDLIFTGTSGETGPMKPGDVVEVELEHVGVLRNVVRAGD